MTDERTNADPSIEAEHAASMLDTLRGALDELRLQADLGTADARARLEPKIDAVRQRQGEARRALLDAKGAGADAWKAAAAQAEVAVDELGDAFSKIADEVQRAVASAGSVVTNARDTFLDEWRRHRADSTDS